MRTSSRFIPIAFCAAAAATLAGCTINRTVALDVPAAPTTVTTVPAVVTTPAPTIVTPAPSVVTPAVIVR